tara:strand:+ start:1741 stop:2814 length:1074 start_codon:yes stop_codon:yes gene_type:complete
MQNQLLTRALLPVAGLLLAAQASAQDPMVVTIDAAASQWQWNGTWQLGLLSGTLVPNPSNTFELSGDFHVLITPGANPISTGQMVAGGTALVQPDLSATVPNPIPLLPDLAVADLTNLTFEFTSPPFAIAANGDFSTDVTMNVLTGNLIVTPSGGTTTITNLAGIMGSPVAVTGNVLQTALNIHIDSPQTGAINFTDPGTGVTGNVSLVGNLVGDHDCPGPTTTCANPANSSGMGGTVSMLGSTRIQDQDLTLVASNLPPGEFAFFVASPSQGFVPFPAGGQGNLCLGTPFARYQTLVGAISPAGEYQIDVDITAIPMTPPVAVMPGEQWFFQCWHRDSNPTPTSNLSDVLVVTFCP